MVGKYIRQVSSEGSALGEAWESDTPEWGGCSATAGALFVIRSCSLLLQNHWRHYLGLSVAIFITENISLAPHSLLTVNK